MAELATKKDEKRFAKPGLTVELVQGDQWVDDLSGISLYRGFYRSAKHKDMTTKEIREKGFVKLEKEQCPTAVIPEEKDLTRVEKALRLGILKIYDPKNPTVYADRRNRGLSKMVYDAGVDSGMRSRNPDDQHILDLLKLKIDKFKEALAKLNTLSMLERIYEAECNGRNPDARVRKPYADALKERINSGDVGGVGQINSKAEEKVVIR